MNCLSSCLTRNTPEEGMCLLSQQGSWISLPAPTLHTVPSASPLPQRVIVWWYREQKSPASPFTSQTHELSFHMAGQRAIRSDRAAGWPSSRERGDSRSKRQRLASARDFAPVSLFCFLSQHPLLSCYHHDYPSFPPDNLWVIWLWERSTFLWTPVPKLVTWVRMTPG